MAVISAGNDIVRDNQVEDPNYISTALVAGLAEKYKLSAVNNDAILVADESPDRGNRGRTTISPRAILL